MQQLAVVETLQLGQQHLMGRQLEQRRLFHVQQLASRAAHSEKPAPQHHDYNETESDSISY